MDVELKRFKLLNHGSELTRDLKIGEIYEMKPFKSQKINGKKAGAWLLLIGDTNRVFTEANLHKCFDFVDTELIGYGQTYDDI